MYDRFESYFVIEKWMLEESIKIRKEYKQQVCLYYAAIDIDAYRIYVAFINNHLQSL